MRLIAGLFAVSAAIIVGAWAWLGSPIQLPPSPLAPGEKLECLSYTPYRGIQSPIAGDFIDPRQIEDDFARLKPITDCVRTYADDHGLERIPEIARRHGLKVMQGIWVSANAVDTRQQIDTAITLAKDYPDVIKSIIVGNEVLLRRDTTPEKLIAIIREVKAQVGSIPVTYADVWEFWLRNPELAKMVDFVTVHMLPYWEDYPIAVEQAGAHIDAIHAQVAAAFPGKDIFIGEVGWPSTGRMREGALPSPANEARLLSDVLARAKRANYHANIIEAFDQPWKRQFEGTVGGYWGVLDAYARAPKFTWGGAISNHPWWRWQAAGGVILAGLVFAAGALSGRRFNAKPSAATWGGVAAIAVVSGGLIGWAIADILVQSWTVADWVRSIAWTVVAAAAPLLGAASLIKGQSWAGFAGVLNASRRRDRLARMTGAAFVALAVLAMHAALGLAFNPRYLDFPFAPLTGTVAPFVVLAVASGRPSRPRPLAETLAAGLVGLCAAYILFNESLLNWQSVWTCAGLAALTGCLLTVRVERG